MRRLIASVAALLLLGSGCASLPWPFSRADGFESGFTQEDLASELASYASRFGATVGSAADDINLMTTQRSVRRRSLIWRLQMPPVVEEVAFNEKPQLGYFGCLLIATAQRNYLTDGDGRALFEGQQQIAIDAANALVEDIVDVGQRFLTKAQLRDVQTKADELAKQHPIQGREFSVQRIPRAVVRAQAMTSLGWLLTLPLAPFQALQGVDSGADAIHDFNRTAQEFAQIVKTMPERVRGQLELFLYDFEDRDTVQETVSALDRVATSSQVASQSIEQMPENLRKLLQDTQQPVDSLGQVVAQAQALAGPLADTAAQLDSASAHWLAILGPKREEPPNSDARPFDVREWQQTATAVGEAAAQLRGLATDLETVSGAASLQQAIDRAFWRGVALIVVFFAALLAYRVLAARLARPS